MKTWQGRRQVIQKGRTGDKTVDRIQNRNWDAGLSRKQEERIRQEGGTTGGQTLLHGHGYFKTSTLYLNITYLTHSDTRH